MSSPPEMHRVGPRATVPADSTRGASISDERSQGIAGWSHATQASQRPSGDGRGADTKSVPSHRHTTFCDPAVDAATNLWTVPVGPTCSSTLISHRPDTVSRPSAYRVLSDPS